MGQNKSQRLTSVLSVVRSLKSETFPAARGAALLLETRTADGSEGEWGCRWEPCGAVAGRRLWKFASGETQHHVVRCNYSAVSRIECGESAGNTPPHWPRYGIGGLKEGFFPISNFPSPRRYQ